MIYNAYGKTGVQVSRLGLGTNRFAVSGPSDAEGIGRAAEIVKQAISGGVNYIDTSYTYSKGAAEKILSLALRETEAKPHIVVKSAINIDQTADSVLQRIEESLKALGIDRATFFLAWTISSYAEYRQLFAKDGYYEGAVRAKERGLIDHICFATHCPPEETVQIIREGAFEGVTLNYSVTNSRQSTKVLETASRMGVGVTAMSVLGTGMIPRHPDFFDFIRVDPSESVPQAALKFSAASPALDVVLCGASSVRQLSDNLEAFQDVDNHFSERQHIVTARLRQQTQLCISCGKCDCCPQKLPVPTLMQSYNGKSFVNTGIPAYRRTDPELLENIEIFKIMAEDCSYMLPDADNPCSRCGTCEKQCPQKLQIADAVADIYRRAEKSACTVQAHENRFGQKFRQYKKIAFYPAGGYTGYLLKEYETLADRRSFQLFLFDSNPQMWGKLNNGILVRPPADLLTVHPDCVLITNYIYSEEIASQLSYLREAGIPVIPFHEKDDVPWVF